MRSTIPTRPPLRLGIPRVVGVGLPQRPCQRIAPLRHTDQMDVIIHQAISPQTQPVPPGMLAEQLQIEEAILVRIKDPLEIVSARRDMIRHPDLKPREPSEA